MDQHGHHALKCHLGPSRYGRHALVVDAVAAFARAAGLPVEREVRLPGAADLRRPGDLRVDSTGRCGGGGARPHRHQADAARTGDAAGVSFQAVILDTYGRREQCGAAFLETLVAAYMRHRGVSQMLASTALHRSLSLAVYRSVAAAVLLRYPGPTLPVASQHWLETGRRLFVGEVLSESEADGIRLVGAGTVQRNAHTSSNHGKDNRTELTIAMVFSQAAQAGASRGQPGRAISDATEPWAVQMRIEVIVLPNTHVAGSTRHSGQWSHRVVREVLWRENWSCGMHRGKATLALRASMKTADTLSP
ncbi:hypothetical protein FVE85_4591 [Porphyridium purpureum]|uniref:Uncharacterized protein n=1 Tax=Porphyridium purpureum TaxID=35688 RepID=A0A5J4YFQ8_PORPP|nr:hypothetical protein FVE85_4591 [Porphyridium purpureum]|eukprot:POR5318..scf252_32